MGLVVYWDKSAKIQAPSTTFWQNQASKQRSATVMTAL